MDWYYGSGISDLLVPKDEDVWDRLPSPDSWSKWGISASEGFNSPKKFSTMDTNPREVEFNFNDESFNNEIELESSLHEKDHSSSSSICGGLPAQSFQQTALSYDQPNYQLQDLSRFEQMDDIFLDSVLEALPSVENLNKAFCFSPKAQCSNTLGGLQKDISASKFVPCNAKPEDCLDIEVLPPVEVLDHFEQSSRDEGMHPQSSLEESILQDLEMVVGQFAEKTRICFRDALYRLARNTQQQPVVQDQDGDLDMQRAMSQTDHNETARSDDKRPMESQTNSIDRAIAKLMFNKMEINVQDLPLATPVNSKQQVIGTKVIQGKSSKAMHWDQNFHYPHSLNLLGDTEVPRFVQSDQKTAAESHISYRDPTKKSLMLELG